MMRQKILHELLDEDQEPFFIGTNMTKNQNQLQLKKPKLISQTMRLAANFSKNSCLFTLPNSPDVRDPTKSPICFSVQQSPKIHNNIFLHVPAKTSTLLLEAALKIQRNSAASKRTTKPPRFGLFVSLFKRLTHISHRRSKTKKRSVEPRPDTVGVDEIDLLMNDAEFDFCHESPFRFVLLKSPPYSVAQTPDLLSSPATSPHQLERNNTSSDTERLKKLAVDEEEEQCSPVCVLDPSFEDDEHHGDSKDDAFNDECSNAIVHMAKQHLFQKRYRFEKLADLDPIELEKRIQEAQDSSDTEERNNGASSVVQVSESSFYHTNSVPNGMKKLVADLIAEEERNQRDMKNKDMVARGVCRRLETWKEVDLYTIDMMVDFDLRRDGEGWVKRPDQEQVGEAAAEIEVAIFGLMVEELIARV